MSTTGTRDTGVSWQKSCSVRSLVAGEVKPLRRSCCRPEKPLHLSWAWSLSSRSRFSGCSRGTRARSLCTNRSAIWYSNSKSDSIRERATQKTVANRLAGWLAWLSSVGLPLASARAEEVEEALRAERAKPCWVQAWMRSRVALRGGSEAECSPLSPNFLGTE